jgi:hypothetical protein
MKTYEQYMEQEETLNTYSKVLQWVFYLMCWRHNDIPPPYSNEEKIRIIASEKKIINKKMFKRHISIADKQKSQVILNETDNTFEELYSIDDIINKMKPDEYDGIHFEIVNKPVERSAYS